MVLLYHTFTKNATKNTEFITLFTGNICGFNTFFTPKDKRAAKLLVNDIINMFKNYQIKMYD